jgi:hypothetical protein
MISSLINAALRGHWRETCFSGVTGAAGMILLAASAAQPVARSRLSAAGVSHWARYCAYSVAVASHVPVYCPSQGRRSGHHRCMEYLSAPMLSEVAIKTLVAVHPWETCDTEGCAGARLPDGDRCWGHAEKSDLAAALQRLSTDGKIDARGVRVTRELLTLLLMAAPHDERRPVLAYTDFSSAIFEEAALFDRVIFKGEAYFDK